MESLIGQRFGRLVVVKEDVIKNGKKEYVLCKCDCGEEKIIRKYNLLKVGIGTKSCGCLQKEVMRKRIIDLTGQRFGRLVVLGRKEGKYRHPKWECICDCGNVVEVYGISLVRKLTSSCGCFQIECATKNATTHGMSHTAIYNRYMSMISRCYHENNPKYAIYGARGIAVCARWLDKEKGFENFFLDMGMFPSKEHSIDRIDVNGNYEPGNCRWATSKEQALNRQDSVYINYKGKNKHISEWGKELGIAPSTLRARIRRGWSEEDIIEKPVSKKYHHRVDGF